MPRTDRYALFLSLLAILAAYFVAERVFERIPHLEDEMAYVWQARVYARGQVTVPSPPHPKSMMVPFVVDYNGHRFAKYPPGWPVVLAFGILLGARAWVNPALAGLGIWLTYRLGQKIFGSGAGLLAAFLTLTSPFFLLNSGSLLAHPWSLVLSAAFALAWLDTFESNRRGERKEHGETTIISAGSAFSAVKRVPRWLTTLVAGLTLGTLALTRPLTAIGVGLPFSIHGLILLWRGDWAVRRRVLFIGAIAIAVGALILLWQYAVTGDPFINPYTLWWSYDKVGFGPGFGRQSEGHNLYWAWRNLEVSLEAGGRDFFGWGGFSWVFLPAGLWAMRRNRPAWLTSAVFVNLAGIYMLYWIVVGPLGPRYYYEGLYSLTLVSAAGILWLADWAKGKNWRKARSLIVALLLALLVGYNLFSYLPARLRGMRGLYGVERADLQPFLTQEAQALAPALIVVHIQETWTDYGALLDLQDPWLTSLFIFALSNGPKADSALQDDYPERQLYHYYPNKPDKFYTSP